MNRHFLDWSVPLLPQAARRLVAHYGKEGEARMDRAIVALPGARAGRRLKELLVEAAHEAGVRLVPPRIVTLGVLPELLYEPGTPFASRVVLRLAWTWALVAADRDRLGRIFAALPDSDALADWSPLAHELAALSRTVAAGGHRFADVADACSGTPLFDDASRWRILAGIQEDVDRRLAAHGLADRDAARIRAVAQGAAAFDGDVWLVGAAEMPAVLGRLLQAAPAPVRALVHAPESQAADFDELGRIRTDAWTGRTLPLDDDRIHVVDTPVHQARITARLLAGLDGAWRPEEIAIGVPDADVIPALEEGLQEAGVAVRDAAGETVAASGPFRLLRAVADFLGGRRYDDLAALVRHPDLAPWMEQAGTGGDGAGDDGAQAPLELWPEDADTAEPADLANLDAWYRRHLPARMIDPYPGGGTREGRAVRELMDRLDTLLLELGGTRPLSEWMAPVLRILATVYAPHGLSEASLRSRRILRALRELRWAAESLGHVPEALDLPCDGATALQLVLLEAASGRIPSAPAEDALELLGWLELHLDDTPVTIVTGANEGALPESVRGDAFLPDSLCRLLGLEDNRQRYARDLYRLTAMAHSREVLHLVAGRRNTAGDPLRPSRLLFAADDETVARRVRRFYGEAAEGEDARADADAPTASGTGGFRLPPEPELDLAARITDVSVTDFRALLEDPYDWALRRFRGLEVVNDALVEMDGALFGTLAHRVLQDFGAAELARHAAGDLPPDPAGAFDETWGRLEAVLDDTVRKQFGAGADPARVAVRLQVEQLRARLRRFARWHVRWMAEGWRMRAVELGTPSGGVPFHETEAHGGRTIGLRARIDRVDYHPASGRWAVFDYKTSDAGDPPEKTHRKGRGDNAGWVDLQLPLYAWLLPRLLTEAAGDPVDVGYILLPRSLDQVGHAMADWDPALLEDGVARARELLDDLLAGPVVFDVNRAPKWKEEEMEALVGRSLLMAGDDDDDGEDA